MRIDELVKKALQEHTLIDALSVACTIECERAMDQRINNPNTGSNGQQWDTCFKFIIERIITAYIKRENIIDDLELIKNVLDDVSVVPENFDFGPSYGLAVDRHRLARIKIKRLLRQERLNATKMVC